MTNPATAPSARDTLARLDRGIALRALAFSALVAVMLTPISLMIPLLVSDAFLPHQIAATPLVFLALWALAAWVTWADLCAALAYVPSPLLMARSERTATVCAILDAYPLPFAQGAQVEVTIGSQWLHLPPRATVAIDDQRVDLHPEDQARLTLAVMGGVGTWSMRPGLLDRFSWTIPTRTAHERLARAAAA